MARLRQEGAKIRLLAVPCPYQPFHSRPTVAGEWETWGSDDRVGENPLWATSLSTVLLGAVVSRQSVRWLMHRDPLAEFPREHAGRDWTRWVLRGSLARPVVTSNALRALLRQREGLEADLLPVEAGNSGSPQAVAAPEIPTLVVDHTAAEEEGLAAVGIALQGLGVRTILLTDLLSPPWTDAFDEVRIRVPDRRPWYASATAILKLDDLHAHEAALGAIWASGRPLLAGPDVLRGFGDVPSGSVWRLADGRADRVRSDVILALEYPAALAAMAARAKQASELWDRTARATSIRLESLPDLDPHELRDLVRRVLADPRCGHGNRTILRRLTAFLDFEA